MTAFLFASYGDGGIVGKINPAFLTPTEFRHTGLKSLPPNGGFLRRDCTAFVVHFSGARHWLSSHWAKIFAS